MTLSVFFTGLLLVTSIAMILVGVHLWRAPYSIDKNSLIYRWIYFWSSAWSRADPQEPPQLSERQIRLYALAVIIAGFFAAALLAPAFLR